MKNKHNKKILSDISRPIKNVKVLINDNTETKNIDAQVIILI